MGRRGPKKTVSTFLLKNYNEALKGFLFLEYSEKKTLSQFVLVFESKGLCEWFEPRSHFISRLSIIVQVIVVLNRTVVDGDW